MSRGIQLIFYFVDFMMELELEIPFWLSNGWNSIPSESFKYHVGWILPFVGEGGRNLNFLLSYLLKDQNTLVICILTIWIWGVICMCADKVSRAWKLWCLSSMAIDSWQFCRMVERKVKPPLICIMLVIQGNFYKGIYVFSFIYLLHIYSTSHSFRPTEL